MNVLTFVDAERAVGELYVTKDIVGNSARIRRGEVRVVDVEGHVFLEFRHRARHGLGSE